MRRLKGETRAVNIDRLEQCIDHGISQLYASFHHLDRGVHGAVGALVVAAQHVNLSERDDRRSLATLVKHLRAAAGGLGNLRATYSDDVGTVARISAMIDSIDQGLTNLQLEEIHHQK